MIRNMVTFPNSYFIIKIIASFNNAASGECFQFTLLADVNGSAVFDDTDTTCLTIPGVSEPTPLLQMELEANCRYNLEKNKVKI